MLLRDVRPGRPTAVRYQPPPPPAVPVELPLPEFGAVALSTVTGTSTSSHDGPPLLVAVADCSASARPPSAFETLVDLALVETTIIDFPNLGSTYNGGWCTATKSDETLLTRPSCKVNVK